MDGEIDRAGQQRLFDLLRKQSLAAGVSERAIHNLVARGADDLDFECLRRDTASLGERAPPAGLEGGPAASRGSRCARSVPESRIGSLDRDLIKLGYYET